LQGTQTLTQSQPCKRACFPTHGTHPAIRGDTGRGKARTYNRELAAMLADEYILIFLLAIAVVPADEILFNFLLLTSSSFFQSSSVPGGRNTNSRTSASPVRCAQAFSMKHLKYIIFYSCSILLIECNNPNITDKDKRNENWVWFVDTKSQKGEWIPVKEKTSVLNGSYTRFYSNGAIYKTGKISNGQEVDTIFYYSPNGKLVSYLKLLTDKEQAYFLNNGLFNCFIKMVK